MKVQWSDGSRSFAKESFEDEEPSGRSREGDNDQLRESSNLILLGLYEKLTKN